MRTHEYPRPQRDDDRRIHRLPISKSSSRGHRPFRLRTSSIDNCHVCGDSRCMKEWPGIGYHIVLTREGKIRQTRELETAPFNATGSGNPTAVGINFVGHSAEVIHPEGQMTSGARLPACLLQELGLPIDIMTGDRQLVASGCPDNQ